MLLRRTLSAAVIALAAVVVLVPSAQAATPGSVQVTGKRLLPALPPASFFGSTYTIKGKYSSGSSLEHERGFGSPAAISCQAAWSLYGRPGFGETAWAFDGAFGSIKTPEVYEDTISQYASPRAALAVFSAERAKAVSCRSYNPPAAKGIPAEHVVQTVTTTRPGGHEAFLITQDTTFSGQPGSINFYTFIALDGADIFSVAVNGTLNNTLPNAPAPSAVTAYMIRKAAALR